MQDDVVRDITRKFTTQQKKEALQLIKTYQDDPDRLFDVLSYLLLLGTDELVRCTVAAAATHKSYDNTEFVCGKCGGRHCTTWERQTRSLDEAATTFAECKCGHRWRVHN